MPPFSPLGNYVCLSSNLHSASAVAHTVNESGPPEDGSTPRMRGYNNRQYNLATHTRTHTHKRAALRLPRAEANQISEQAGI